MRDVKDQDLEAIAGAGDGNDADVGPYFPPRSGLLVRGHASLPGPPEDPPGGGNTGYWTVIDRNGDSGVGPGGGNSDLGPA